MINQKQIRTLLRKTANKFISLSSVMLLLKFSKKKGIELLRDLEERGYIEKSEVDDEYWVVSLRGKVLANTVSPKQFKSETLQKHVANLIERTETVNASPKFPLLITCIKIIGQYPLERRDTGVIIAYTLKHKPITEEEYNNAANKLRQEYRGILGNIIEYYNYPNTAVKRFLKSGSKVLKMMSYTEEKLKLLDGHIVFGE